MTVRAGGTRLARLSTSCLLATASLAAQAKSPDAVLQAIQAHLKNVPAELARYDGLAFYGETQSGTMPSKAAIAAEVALLADAKASGLLAKLPPEVQQLGHNVIVHSPAMAQDYLDALHDAANGGDRKIHRVLYFATMAAGEAGERAAVAELQAEKAERRLFWASLLSRRTIYTSSVGPIEKRVGVETDSNVRAALVRALASIGSPTSIPVISDLVEHAKDDAVQAAAIWACVEAGGFDQKGTVEKAKPVGPMAKKEQSEGLEYLDKETSAKNKHGREVGNNPEFVQRFGDLLTCPTIKWLADEHLLEEQALEQPPKLEAAPKKKLLELLLDSRGFGMEAVKGALFVSLAKTDEGMLLNIRAAGFCAPNPFADDRVKTIDLMLRHIRQDL